MNDKQLTQYTFTFSREDERQFRNIMSRLEPDEFRIVSEIAPTDTENKYSDLQTVMEMEPEAASTFRFGMKVLKIRRLRTEEELAEEKANEDRHKVTIVVHTGQQP